MCNRLHVLAASIHMEPFVSLVAGVDSVIVIEFTMEFALKFALYIPS